MWFILLTIFMITIFSYLYLLSKKSRNYWQEQNVATLQSSYGIFGDIKDVLFGRENLADVVNRAYKKFKQLGVKFGGVYIMNRPVFIPINPQLIRDMIVKDFDHFVNRGIHTDKKKDPLGAHIFSLNDDEWRTMRQKLSPSFTSGKLKQMMEALQLHADNLVKKIDGLEKRGDVVLNDYFEQIGIDIIANVAFGLNCNTLTSTQGKKFFKMTERIFHPKISNILKFLFFEDSTNPGNLINLTSSDHDMTQFYLKLIQDTVTYRKLNSSASAGNKDFLQLLLQMHMQSDLSVEQIAAQTFIFFIAAYETSSKALNYTMYELSKNQSLQEELRREITANVANFTYEEIMKNKMLDAVLKETLRKHPSVVYLHRQCNKPYRISSDYVLEKDVVMLIPVYAIHHDPGYFVDPEVYDPKRFFNEGLVDPLTYFPFGDGPRNCIGMRFALLQVKLIIAKLVSNFAFSQSIKTVEPLEFKPIMENLLLNYKQSIYFNVERV